MGFIGRFTAQKNILFLISIAKELSELGFNFKLFLIGDGNLHSEIVHQIEIANLTKRIRIIDSNPDVYKFYSFLIILFYLVCLKDYL